MNKKIKKKPKANLNPRSKKQPRLDPSIPTSSLQLKPSWKFESIDIKGPWGWGDINREDLLSKVLKRIIAFESMKWHEILNKKNHEIKISKITVQARKRLEKLRLDDIESLVSLTIEGPIRIWGIKVHNYFKVLWWDPLHKVYQNPKKHT